MAVGLQVNATVDQNQAVQLQPSSEHDDFQINSVSENTVVQTNGKQPGGLITRGQANRLVNEANSILKPVPTNLHYVYYAKLDRYYVQIENSETHEVIEEIPPKKLLDFAASIAEKLGLIVNKRI